LVNGPVAGTQLIREWRGVEHKVGSTAPRWSSACLCGSSAAAAGSGSSPPDGSAVVPTNKPQPDGTLVKALVRAWRWQKLLDGGVYTSVTEIPDTAKADQKLPRADPAVGEKGPLGTSTLRILLKAAQCWLQGRAGYAESRSMSHRASRPRKVIAALRWEALWSDCWETKA
jgi:hypothetical protein